MVDQPEGRPKSPGPGKVKPVTKKHSVSKPYERPSSSRGVLARVKELITPVTPGWLKDLVLRPPQATSITDALEQTVAEVQAADEKGPEEFKKTLKTLSLPLTEVKREPKLPFTTERIPTKPKTTTPSILDVSETNTTLLNKTNVLEETLGDIKWSTIRPAVKEKYAFSVAAFNTPSKSPNLSAISIHNKSLSRTTTSPFTNRSRVSFGGNSLQRSLLHNRSASNASANDDKKPIKVKPISRTAIRPGVTSNTAKKILEQLESLSRPLGHLPSSRPSTPSSRPCSRASTPLSLSRPSTPQHPYKTERSIPIRSLTSTPHEKCERGDLNMSTSSSVGGKMKRERTNYKDYSRMKEEEEELIIPNYETISVEMDFKPIELDKHTDHKPIKIVNQTSSQQKDHVPLKDAIRNTLTSNISPLIKKKSLSPPSENDSTDSSFSFSAPITVTNSALSTSSLSDSAEFSFGAPGSATPGSATPGSAAPGSVVLGLKRSAQSVEDIMRSVREKTEEEKVEIAAQEPPGSWSCVPCKLSNPSAMTRCSGCEAPNPSFQLPGLFKLHSPIGIKRAPITPMKPAVSPKFAKMNPVSFGLGKIKEESPKEEGQKEETKPSPLVKFSLPHQSGWACGTCMLRNKEDAVTCIACQAAKPAAKPAESALKPSLTSKLAGMDNPLLKFKKTNNWSCNTCMLSNPADLDKCQACQADKPALKAGSKQGAGSNPLLRFAQTAGWNCDTCMLKNDNSADKCKACETPKPGAKPAEKPASTGVFQTLGKFKQTGWSCNTCLLTNPETDLKCKACQTLKPGVKPEDIKAEEKKEEKPSTTTFTFGVGSLSGPSDAKPGFGDFKPNSKFDFGSKTDGGEGIGFTFGSKSKAEEKSDKPAFALTTSTDKPAFSFAVKNDPDSKPAESKPAFSFGPASSTGDSKPSFNFGGSSTTESKPAFGSLTSEPAPKFNFGGGSSSEKKPETSTAPKFNFGGSTTEKKDPPAFNFGGTSIEKKDTAGFNFGGGNTTSTAETKPALEAKSGFSFSSGTTSTAPASGFSFGGTTSSAPAFNFGANKPATSVPSPAPAPGFTAAPKSESSSFQFGPPATHNTDSGDTMDASSQSPKGFSFGQKPAATNGPTFNFGSSNNGSTGTGFNFSSSTSTNPAPAFGASTTSASTFGASTSPAPTFGASTTPAPTFGTSSTPAPTFGTNSTAAPTFGTNSTAAPTFGTSSTPSFGSTTSNANTSAPAFSFGQNSSTFGQSSNTSTGFNFGGAPKPATTGFNFSAAAPQAAPSTGFNFSGNTTSTSTPSFSFGGGGASTTFGNSCNTSTPTPAPSFGNTPAIPAPSFNFGAAGSTPSNSAFQFGSPQSTPTQNNNMFNPVSSSTSGRRIRKAVRRTKR